MARGRAPFQKRNWDNPRLYLSQQQVQKHAHACGRALLQQLRPSDQLEAAPHALPHCSIPRCTSCIPGGQLLKEGWAGLLPAAKQMSRVQPPQGVVNVLAACRAAGLACCLQTKTRFASRVPGGREAAGAHHAASF